MILAGGFGVQAMSGRALATTATEEDELHQPVQQSRSHRSGKRDAVNE